MNARSAFAKDVRVFAGDLATVKTEQGRDEAWNVRKHE